MNQLKQCLLGAYYMATLPTRRRAAVDRAARQTEPVRVLFYHRVADQHPNGWTMSTSTFAEQIQWLQSRYDLVSLSEAQLRITSGKNRWPTACITFDDGYADNCEFAIPLLLQRRIPFTYFISTDQVLHDRPFEHDVNVGQILKPNTVSQLRDMVDAGVDIGAHTRGHVHLGPSTTREQMADEIVGSKRELETALRTIVRYFAFPFGQLADLTPTAFQIAYHAGFQGVCSAYGGYNLPGDDPFHLRRIHADPEFIRFKNWLTVDPRKLKRPIRFEPGNYRSETFESAAEPESSNDATFTGSI
jgi:peptidoglycan/xylan/chitin deacetylase (PgdA/CDA1 family)